MLILIVASGPDKGKTYELHGNHPVVLGREGDQVKLSDTKVSRKHAQLTCEDGSWYIKDLNSRHGTHRNHQPITEKSPLHDGDYLQLGRTVMVASRMQVEQAERLALLGNASGWMEPPTLEATRKRPSLAAAAIFLAAASVVGLNLFQYLHSTRQTQTLEQQLADVRAAADTSAHQLLAEVQQITPSDQQAMLEQILASVNTSQQKIPSLEQIQSALASLPKPQNVSPALQAILAQLRSQPQRDADQWAKLTQTLQRQASHTQPMLQQLAQTTQTNHQALEQIHQAISQTHDNLTHAIHDASLAQRQQQTQTLATLLEKINHQPTYDAQLAQLRQLIETQPTRLESLLAQNDSPRNTADQLDKLSLELASLRTRLPDHLAQQLDRLVTQLDAQPNPDQLAQAVAQVIAHNPTGLSPALEQLAKRLEEQPTAQALAASLREALQSQPDPVTPVLKKLLARLETQPSAAQWADQWAQIHQQMDRQATPGQIAQAVTEVIQSQPDPITPALQALAAKLDQQPTAGEVLAGIRTARQDADQQLFQRLNQLAASIQNISRANANAIKTESPTQLAFQTQTATLLNQVLDQVKNRQPIDALRDQLQTLAAATTQSANDPRLTQILDALQNRQQADAQLDQLAQLLTTWPTQNQQHLDRILQAIQQNSGPSPETLAQILDQLHHRETAMADTVREQVRQSLANTQFTLAPNTTGQASTDTVHITPLNPPAQPPRDAQAPPLTPVEEAYRIAFETDQPLRLGAGVKNPITGQLSKGRQLDPAAAKAAGITTWRQWYLADDFSQRMRLERAASDHLKDSATTHDAFRLPTSH